VQFVIHFVTNQDVRSPVQSPAIAPAKICSEFITLTMQAIEAMGTVDAQGHLSLDQPLQVSYPSRVRVIVLLETEVASGDDQADVADSQHSSAQSFLGMIDEIRAQVPAEEWKKLPTDLSKNIDHYLYGSPKVEE